MKKDTAKKKRLNCRHDTEQCSFTALLRIELKPQRVVEIQALIPWKSKHPHLLEMPILNLKADGRSERRRHQKTSRNRRR